MLPGITTGWSRWTRRGTSRFCSGTGHGGGTIAGNRRAVVTEQPVDMVGVTARHFALQPILSVES